MKTILLIGAGLTRSQKPRAALKSRPPLDADFFQIAKAIEPTTTSEVMECLNSLVGDYSESLSESLETAASYLYIKAIDNAAGSPYHLALLQLMKLLNIVLSQTTNTIRIGPRALLYRFILSELRKVNNPEDLTIITFNYDLMVERALSAIAEHGHPDVFSFPGCYRIQGLTRTSGISGWPSFPDHGQFGHGGVPVLKLHGSMNWQSKHTSNTPTPSALFNSSREMHVLHSPVLPWDLSWRPRSRRVYLKPVIIPPVTGKRGMMHEKIMGLWSLAAEALQQADRVVVAGYSCPPLDLEARILLSENMRANRDKRVYVVDPNPDVMGKFLELCGVDHITFYTSVKNWIRDAAP
ncbi:MAG: hypothetical protein AAGI72_17770 [Pseudomonadota bacterium]